MRQNKSFRRPGYLPSCSDRCTKAISEPDANHHLSALVTKKVKSAAGEKFVPIASMTESQMFASARSIECGGHPFADQTHEGPFIDSIPENFAQSARDCANTILAGECPVYFFFGRRT
jgi:hypothetical protein